MNTPIKSFTQFISEKLNEQTDLFKVYLAIDPDSGHRWWSYKGFAADNFFIQITLDNYKDIDINKDYPILTYNSAVVEKLIEEKLVKKENVYNRPEFIKQSGSKAEFHKIVDGDENIPKTFHSEKEALDIGFPIIAKPAEGHSGIGIQIFKNKEEWDKADHSKFDVYSEFIDKKSEHRLINFKGTPFFWMEREPMNDKAKSGKGKGDEEMSFKYIKHDISKLPSKFNTLVEKFCKMFSDLPYICFDIMEDMDGKLYIIESNSQPGVPYDSTVQIYRQLFNDFYGREVDKDTNTKLIKLSKDLDAKTLDTDSKRFEIRK